MDMDLNKSQQVSKEIKILVGTLKEFGISAAQISKNSSFYGYEFPPSTLSRSMAPESKQKISLARRFKIVDTTRRYVRAEAKRDNRIIDRLKELEIDLSIDKDYLVKSDDNLLDGRQKDTIDSLVSKSPSQEELLNIIRRLVDNHHFVPWQVVKDLEQQKAKEVLVITSDLEWIRNYIDEILDSFRNNEEKKFRVILTEEGSGGLKNEKVIQLKMKNADGIEDLANRLNIKHLFDLDPYSSHRELGIPLLNDIVLYKIPTTVKNAKDFYLEGYYSITSLFDTDKGIESKISKRKTEELELWFETIWNGLKKTHGEAKNNS